MADHVFVVDSKGKPLMPTKRRGRVRHLLKEGKAVVIKTHPFAIKMKYDVGHYTQPMYEGIDSGRQNIGNAVSKARMLMQSVWQTEMQQTSSLQTISS